MELRELECSHRDRMARIGRLMELSVNLGDQLPMKELEQLEKGQLYLYQDLRKGLLKEFGKMEFSRVERKLDMSAPQRNARRSHARWWRPAALREEPRKKRGPPAEQTGRPSLPIAEISAPGETAQELSTAGPTAQPAQPTTAGTPLEVTPSGSEGQPKKPKIDFREASFEKEGIQPGPVDGEQPGKDKKRKRKKKRQDREGQQQGDGIRQS
jgi:hypothetical protein